jgi:S1-C subfamily serine protease
MKTNQKPERRNLSNTLSAGVKSLRGGGRKFYVLEFKTPSQLKKSNTTQEIIIDYIELGRDPKCQVVFGEDCRTVSGVHCSISREGDDYFIRHLSKTNPTLVNGKPVADRWYLNSGDEIRLAYDGPLIGFIVPQNNLASSIPLTRRMELFRDQALRPFKVALATLAAMLLLAIASGFWMMSNWRSEQETLRLNNSAVIELLGGQVDSLRQQNANNQALIDKLKNSVRNLQNPPRPKVPVVNNATPVPDSLEMTPLYNSTFLIYAKEIEFQIKGEVIKREGNWSGTGFLLADGRFVTARHVVEPWFFLSRSEDDELLSYANIVASNGGKVSAEFEAISPTGESFTFKTHGTRINRTQDEVNKMKTEDNTEYLLTTASPLSDWATLKLSKAGTIQADAVLSTAVPVGSRMFTLGFPFGMGVSETAIRPIYSDFTVGSTGLVDGFISISGRSFDPGNSGGPVFVKTDNGFVAVGIVSAGIGTRGIIIPIAKID